MQISTTTYDTESSNEIVYWQALLVCDNQLVEEKNDKS